ncbi:protein of unknown function [Bartonella clarridgeiae 73]|uniref:Uncharacterized protein n=1 Tax=Bartonella clarridgeiae (strain CCUG 45776 / CIP 104772 / 73) TaxID=696125 RepID=E6YIU0_BARC7|nr:protein of unknown function [Bartonella clarridgeiae 73]
MYYSNTNYISKKILVKLFKAIDLSFSDAVKNTSFDLSQS